MRVKFLKIMDSREIGKETDVSIHGVATDVKEAGISEKNVAEAYPDTTHDGEGRSLRVGLCFYVVNLVRNMILTHD